MIEHAYDIRILPQAGQPGAADGWVFGLPAGIAQEQWPLDPNTGFPLMHAFTLRLPEDYRVHGSRYCAVSFFGIALDHNDGVPVTVPNVRSVLTDLEGTAPSDSALAELWRHGQSAHPQLYRMKDLLECEYAAILLTQEEFSGPATPPPEFRNYSAPNKLRPRWMYMGGARAYFDSIFSPHLTLKPEEYHFAKRVGGVPPAQIHWSRALSLEIREDDPNAGRKAVCEYRPNKTVDSEYESRFDSNRALKPWAENLGSNHLGGTMRPTQLTPDMSPAYVEFDEELGGFNFGGGNAQLDILNMKFDWACG